MCIFIIIMYFLSWHLVNYIKNKKNKKNGFLANKQEKQNPCWKNDPDWNP